jgi:concanavalin A-like lectin/glucanase superfamily protein
MMTRRKFFDRFGKVTAGIGAGLWLPKYALKAQPGMEALPAVASYASGGNGCPTTLPYAADLWLKTQDNNGGGAGSTLSDASGNGNTCTMPQGCTWGSGQNGGYSVGLNGSNQCIYAPGGVGNYTTDSFAISMWVKFGSVGFSFLCSNVNGSGGYSLTVSGGQLEFTDNTAGTYTASGIVTTGTWYLISVVISGIAYIYLNGSNVNSGNYGLNITPGSSASSLCFGNSVGGGSSLMTGNLQDIIVAPNTSMQSYLSAMYAAGAPTC